jgi:peptide/nickel transport system substrate-binding protein
MKMKIMAVALIVMLAVLVGCTNNIAPSSPTASGSIPGKPKVQGIYISGTYGGDAETLNWILAADDTSLSYAGRTMDSLAGYDNDFNVVLNHMAKPVQVSDDGLTYTVTIRDDLKWSNGQPVTAEDYVYTLKNLMFSDWLNYPYKDQWQEPVNGKMVFVEPAVVNTTTFTIKKQTVDPEFADNVIYSMTPYPKYIAVKYEGNIKAFTEAPEFNTLSYTGNLGPYKYSDWIRNDKFVVDRNPDFYLGKDDGSPYFKQREIKILGNSTQAQAALKAGDITVTGIDPDKVPEFKQLPNIKVYTTASTGYDLVLINQLKNGWEGLRNKAVRQALAMSVSKKSVIDSIRMGFGDPAFSFIPNTSPFYTEDGVAKYGWESAYNKSKAKQMLLDAGYGVKKADGSISVQDKNGQPVKLTLVTTPDGPISQNTAYLVKQELSDIGISVDIKLVPWETLLRQYVKNKTPGSAQQPAYNNGLDSVSEQQWDMIIMALSTNPVSPSGSRVFFTTNGGLNYFGYSDPKVDDLFNKLSSKDALDKNFRKQVYGDISRAIADDQPAIFLDFPRHNTGIQATVQGIEMGKSGSGINLGWNSHQWYFAQP